MFAHTTDAQLTQMQVALQAQGAGTPQASAQVRTAFNAVCDEVMARGKGFSRTGKAARTAMPFGGKR